MVQIFVMNVFLTYKLAWNYVALLPIANLDFNCCFISSVKKSVKQIVMGF